MYTVINQLYTQGELITLYKKRFMISILSGEKKTWAFSNSSHPSKKLWGETNLQSCPGESAVTFLGGWKRDPFKGFFSWPPTIGE